MAVRVQRKVVAGLKGRTEMWLAFPAASRMVERKVPVAEARARLMAGFGMTLEEATELMKHARKEST